MYPRLRRRAIFSGAVAVAVAAVFPLPQAVAQTASARGDWFTMVRAQHALVSVTLEKIVASGAEPTCNASVCRMYFRSS
jgi:hypothetical protein